MDAAFLVMSLPSPDLTQKVELPGYSLGPASLYEADELILTAVPASEGEVYFTGRVQWTGLENVSQPSGHLIQSIVAITDLKVLFLWWQEHDERYETLILLPYTGIYSVALKTPGFGALIKFCHKGDEILIGNHTIFIDQETTFNFLKSGLFGDAEKTKKAYKFLDRKINLEKDLEQLPSPCEDDLELDTDHQGFGQEDVIE